MDKWINCKNCGHHYSKRLSRCPECSALTPLSLARLAPFIIGGILLIGIILIVILGGRDNKTAESSSDIDLISNASSQDNTSNSPNSKIESSSNSNSSLEFNQSSEAASQDSYSENSTTIHSSSQADTADNKIIDNMDKAVTGSKKGEVQFTIPDWLLYNIDPYFDYEITPEDLEAGITDITQNSDGSATYTIASYDTYKNIVRNSNSLVEAAFNDFNVNDHLVNKVDYSNDFSLIKLETTTDDWVELETCLYPMIMSTGYTICYNQLIDLDKPLKCVFEICTLEQTVKTITFPQDAIKLLEYTQ